jgi:PAS domain S-box-containing protein
VGKDILEAIVGDYPAWLGTSAIVFEKNGAYVLARFPSGWCRKMDTASRALCNTTDNAAALACGSWHCHESCWQAARTSMETGQPVDEPCLGGIHIHAAPIRAGGEVVGSITIGYGEPPADPRKLQELAQRYDLDLEELRQEAATCRARTPFVIEEARRRLALAARLIGEIVHGKRAQQALQQRSCLANLSADIGLALTRTESVREMLQKCTESVVRHLDAAFARVWTLNAAENVLELQASAGMYTHLDGAHRRVPVGRFKIGMIAEERRPHLTNDVLHDPRISDVEWARREGMVAFAGYPLLLEDRLVGVMAMFSRRPFSDFTLEALGHISDIISLGIGREQSREALCRSEDRLRAFIAGAQDVIFDVSPEGRFLALNPAFEKVTGWPVSRWLDKPFPELLHPDDVPQGMELYQRVLAGEAPPCFEMRLNTRSGAPVTVEVTVAPHVQNGVVVRASGIARNITDRKRLEEQFRQAQKLEAVGRLAGGVAHDFNNLLTVILGCGDLVLGGLREGDPLRVLVEEIKKASLRAASLTRQLLAFSRRQVLAPVVLDLNALVTDMEKMLHRLIGEDIDLKVVPDPQLWRMKADCGQIEQILMNLVVNARDAMPRGGKLTIGTRNVELDQSYTMSHPYVQPGQYILLAVSDTGCGMDDATRSRIFEPFFTTKGPEKGTGLGLATVYGIVKQSGGHIEVYSEPGIGSTFKIYLPRTRSGVPLGKSHPGLTPARRGTETILLVEDEEGVRTLARLVLQQHGYAVLEAQDGVEAAQICQRHPGTIHLLVTDVIMPRMSGRQVASHLAPMRPSMKVLYLSGYTDDAIVHHGVLDPDTPFLQKPFTTDALLRKVREVLE